METFAQRMAECQKAKDQEIASEKALAAGGAANDEAEESEVTKLAKGQVAPVPSSYKKGSDEYFTATAAEMANIYVSVIAQPSTDAAFQKAISESSLSPANVKGTAGKNCVLIHLDTQLVGESQKRPNIRLPPLDSGVCQCLVSNALKARGSVPVGKNNLQVDQPIEGDLMVVNDGGRRDDSALAAFKSSKTRGVVNAYLEHWEVTCILSEDSIRQKKKRNRGNLQQVMKLHFTPKEPVERMVPERKHEKYPGTSRGNALGFINLATASATWHSTVEHKKANLIKLFILKTWLNKSDSNVGFVKLRRRFETFII